MTGTARSESGSAFWILLGAIALLGLAQASAIHLKGSLTVDEPLVAHGFRLPWSRIREAILHDNLPLYYVVMKVWAAVFGDSEVALRSFSLLCFGMAIVAVGVTARSLVDAEGGLIAALLLAVSSIGQFHAVSARPYTLLSLIVAGALLVVSRLANPPPDGAELGGTIARRQGVALGALAALHVLGLLAHPIYVFFLCVLPLAALALSRRAFGTTLVASGLAVALFFVIWWPAWRETLGLPTINWMERPGFGTLRDAFLSLWGRQKTPWLVIAVVTLLAVRPSRAGRALTDPVWRFSASIVIASTALLLAVSQLHPIFNPGRTPMIILPAMCVLLAVSFRHTGARVATVAVLALLVGASTWSAAQARIEDRIPTRASVAWVAGAARCGDTLVLGSLSVGEVEYYWHRLRAPECVSRETFPSVTQLHPAWIDVPGNLAHKDQLVEEAARTAERLAARSGSTVWLFHSRGERYAREVTNVLEAELNRRLERLDPLPLEGTYFDTVSRYVTTGSAAQGSGHAADRGTARGDARDR